MLYTVINMIVIFAFAVLSIISMIHSNYTAGAIWLSLGIIASFFVSYSKWVYRLMRSNFSINQISKMTQKLFTDLVFK